MKDKFDELFEKMENIDEQAPKEMKAMLDKMSSLKDDMLKVANSLDDKKKKAMLKVKKDYEKVMGKMRSVVAG